MRISFIEFDLYDLIMSPPNYGHNEKSRDNFTACYKNPTHFITSFLDN